MFLTWYTIIAILHIIVTVKVAKFGIPNMNVLSKQRTAELGFSQPELVWRCFRKKQGHTTENSAGK